MKTPPSLHMSAIACTRAAVLAAASLLLPASLFAQAFPTWQGTGTNWNDSANWNVAYGYGQLQWTGNGNATSWNNLANPESQWRFYFSGSQAYTLGGNAVSFFDFSNTNGGILNDSSVTQTINNNLNFADTTVGEAFIFNRSTAGGALTLGGTITLTGNISYLGIGGTNGSGNITFNGPIVGNKGVVIGTNSLDLNGTGMVGTKAVFNGSNSYTGTTTILRGNLAITNGNSLSTNSVILGLGGVVGLIDAGLTVNGTTTASNNFRFADAGTNVTLTVTNGAAFTISGALANDTGSSATTKFSKAGAGTLILANAASTYAGQLQIGDGTVVIGSSAALSTNITTANRGIDLGLNLRDVSQANNVSLLLSNGVTLSNSVYVAPNTSSALRTIGIAGTGTATISNQVFLDGNLTFDIGAGNNISSLNVPANNAFTGTGGLIKVGDGTLTLAGLSSYTGKTVLAGGKIFMTGVNELRFGANPTSFTADSLTISNGGFLITSNSSSVASTWNANRGITIGAGGATWQIVNTVDLILAGTNQLNGTGDLVKAGSGTLTLANSNSFSGTFRTTNSFPGSVNLNHQFALGNATLVLTNGGAIPKFGSVAGTAFTLGGLAASAAGVGSDLVLTNTAGTAITLTVGGANTTTSYSANLGGVGASLTKVGTGTLNLNSSNSFTGTLTVSDGRLGLYNFSVGNSILASNIVINGGRLSQISGGGNANGLITNTAAWTISSGSYTNNFLAQTMGSLSMSGGSMGLEGANITVTGAAAVTGGAITNNTANNGANGRVFFDGGLAVGGATFAFNNANHASNTVVRINESLTYASTNTAAAWFTNTAAGVGQLQLISSTNTNTWNIADAAGVASEVNVDWTVTGASQSLVKSGTGVLTLGGTNANTYDGLTKVTGGLLALNKSANTAAIAGNVEVATGGKLLISASEQVANTSAVTLSGGTIERASGVDETMGNLSLTAASTMDYVSGAAGTVTFGTYTPSLSTKLTINGFSLGNTLRFVGSDLSSFINASYVGTSFDNGYFAINGMESSAFGGFRSAWDSGSSTFTITSVPEPSTVAAAAGLLGLMAWGPLRRRFRKQR